MFELVEGRHELLVCLQLQEEEEGGAEVKDEVECQMLSEQGTEEQQTRAALRGSYSCACSHG